MGPIKPYLPDCGRRRRVAWGGRGVLVLPLMDGLRNGPYRMCHTASGDVLMGYRGGPPTLLQHFVSRQKGTKVGRRTRRVRKRVFKYRNLGAIIEGPEGQWEPGCDQVC